MPGVGAGATAPSNAAATQRRDSTIASGEGDTASAAGERAENAHTQPSAEKAGHRVSFQDCINVLPAEGRRTTILLFAWQKRPRLYFVPASFSGLPKCGVLLNQVVVCEHLHAGRRRGGHRSFKRRRHPAPRLDHRVDRWRHGAGRRREGRNRPPQAEYPQGGPLRESPGLHGVVPFRSGAGKEAVIAKGDQGAQVARWQSHVCRRWQDLSAARRGVREATEHDCLSGCEPPWCLGVAVKGPVGGSGESRPQA